MDQELGFVPYQSIDNEERCVPLVPSPNHDLQLAIVALELTSWKLHRSVHEVTLKRLREKYLIKQHLVCKYVQRLREEQTMMKTV